MFDTPGSRIIDNEFSYGRDGVFSVNSHDDEVRGNSFRNLRFAVHFMYTNNSSVIDNVSVGNDIGYAMMYSDRLVVTGNASDRDREHGLLFNYANDSRIEDNAVRDSDKCVFIYNANKNRFSGNWFQGCNIGVHFTAGSEQNQMTGNSFVNNRTQVMYVGTSEPGLVGQGARQLLQRQSRLRSQRRRDRRSALPTQRFDGSGHLARAGGEAVVEQSGGSGGALGAGALSGDSSRRRVRLGAADEAAASACAETVERMKHEPLVMNAVEMRDVNKRYGRIVAVDAMDLTLRAGECVGLVGHNGAGKSTLIKMMLGLLSPTSGSVKALGEEPGAAAAASVRRELGYLPENLALYPSLTGAETLNFYARLKRGTTAGNAALLKRVGLEVAAGRRVGTYSKGMRQRLGLAQALLGSPRALFLDEPTAGLDPASRQDFYAILRELRRDGAMVLLSSHALAELEGQVDRVVVMNRGRKVADGAITELRRLAAIQPRIRFQPVAAHDRFEGWTPIPGGQLERCCAGRGSRRDAARLAGFRARH